MTVEDKFLQDGELNDEDLEKVSGGGSGKDSIDEMSQQDMLNLQRAMEKKGQLESMISNTMKANSETASGIISNLKGS